MWLRYAIPGILIPILASLAWISWSMFKQQPVDIADFFNHPARYQKAIAKKPLHIHDRIIENKHLKKATLAHACWENVVLNQVEFNQVTFDDMHLENSIFNLVDFKNTLLKNTTFEKVMMNGQDIVDQYDLPRNFAGSTLQKVTFSNARLIDIDFSDLKQSEIHFENCILSRLRFDRAKVKLTFKNTQIDDTDLEVLASESETLFISQG